VLNAGVLFIASRNGYPRAAFTETPAMAKKARPTAAKSSRTVVRPRAQTESLLRQMGVLRVTLIGLVILDMLAAPRPARWRSIAAGKW